MARNGAAFEFDAHEFLRRALGLLLHDGFLADKVLVPLDVLVQTHFDGIGVGQIAHVVDASLGG